MTPDLTPDSWIATSCFAAALLHSLTVVYFERLARRFEHRSFASAVFHFLAEIEVVFGLWAGIFVIYLMATRGLTPAMDWLETKNFGEAIFVFIIMAMSATRPVVTLATKLIQLLARLIPLKRVPAIYLTTLVIGPLLGSLVTEPAAMTVAALILRQQIFNRIRTMKLVYSTVAVLFVNVSIGGTLTSFAAPPVLMVARPWGWDTQYMLTHFGWKAAIAVVLNALLAFLINRGALQSIDPAKLSRPEEQSSEATPVWVQVVNVGFVLLAILGVHHPVFLGGLFLFFLGFVQSTASAQSELKIRESLLVAFFLSGLVVLTGEQTWWLKPILTSLHDTVLYLSAAGLTAITDNAALTSLAAQVPDLAISSKHAVVAGAVVGGGLTLIANAPNPAGYAILRPDFGADGIHPVRFFLWALPPTGIALLFFLF